MSTAAQHHRQERKRARRRARRPRRITVRNPLSQSEVEHARRRGRRLRHVAVKRKHAGEDLVRLGVEGSDRFFAAIRKHNAQRRNAMRAAVRAKQDRRDLAGIPHPVAHGGRTPAEPQSGTEILVLTNLPGYRGRRMWMTVSGAKGHGAEVQRMGPGRRVMRDQLRAMKVPLGSQRPAVHGKRLAVGPLRPSRSESA